MMNKNFFWISGVVVLIILLGWWGKSAPTLNPPLELNVINPVDHVKGNASSSVVIMEYSDFQCPACRAYYPVLREVMTEFGDRVGLVYRYFPLTSIHMNAEMSARAAEAASKQGKFWEMHDLLFEKQSEWAERGDSAQIFESYAKLIGISVDQFKTDLASTQVKQLVRAEKAYAQKIGLQGTPTFFINGKKIENPRSVQEFKELIRKALGQ
jgi:protein-disulfide isomerase